MLIFIQKFIYMIDRIKYLFFVNKKRNYSIDSCEEVVGDFEEEMNNYEVFSLNII